MEFLIIQTAVPFGYLIFTVIFIIVFIVSCSSAITSIKSKPLNKLKLTLSSISILFLFLIVSANLFQDEIDLNPLIRGSEPLVGIWQNNDSQLTLSNNGQYSCSGTLCSSINTAGQWKRYQDFEIDLKPTTGTAVRWRITKNVNKNSYQLISGAVGDPDLWQTHVAFTKQINP